MGCSHSSMNNAQTPRAPPMLTRESATSYFESFIAFQIDIKDNETKDLNKDIDKILSKPLPKRLQRLEPLDGATKLTSEDLQKKLEIAEMKRQKSVEKRLEFSRRGSVRRSVVTELQDGELPTNQEIIREKLKIAEKLRQQKLIEMQIKQKTKSEISENGNKIRDEGIAELRLECNEAYHDDNSDDSWSDSCKSKSKVLQTNHNYDSSGYSSRNISASKAESSKNPLKTPDQLSDMKPCDESTDKKKSINKTNQSDNHNNTPNYEIDWSD